MNSFPYRISSHSRTTDHAHQCQCQRWTDVVGCQRFLRQCATVYGEGHREVSSLPSQSVRLQSETHSKRQVYSSIAQSTRIDFTTVGSLICDLIIPRQPMAGVIWIDIRPNRVLTIGDTDIAGSVEYPDIFYVFVRRSTPTNEPGRRHCFLSGTQTNAPACLRADVRRYEGSNTQSGHGRRTRIRSQHENLPRQTAVPHHPVRFESRRNLLSHSSLYERHGTLRIECHDQQSFVADRQNLLPMPTESDDLRLVAEKVNDQVRSMRILSFEPSTIGMLLAVAIHCTSPVRI